MARLTLAERLFGMFAFVWAIASAPSFYGLHELRNLNLQTQVLQPKSLPGIAHATDMNTHLSNFYTAQVRHVIADADEATAGLK